MRKLFIISLFFGLLSLPCFSQNGFFDNYVYQSWNAFGTLSGTTANDIYQTKDGYINIGTYEGLVRFDGVSFTSINRALDSDYSIVSVRCIIQDSRGDIWLGSNDEGLQRISSSGNRLYTVEDGLPNNSIRALAEDQSGNIWIGTAGGVVYLTPDGKLISPQFAPGTTSNGVIASNIFCDSVGRIWLTISNENGFFLFTNGVFRPLLEFEKFGRYFATAIYQDSTGVFWIGLGEKGLIRMHNGGAIRLETNTILDTIPTCAILEDTNGDLWFGTEKGLVVYSNGEFIEYKQSQELIGSNINKIIQDRENNIWIATDRNGIGKMTLGKFKLSRLGVTVNALDETPDGRVWAGTDSGLFCYNKNDELEENELTRYAKGLRIRHIETTSDGKLLISCYTKPGQILYDGKTIKSWSTDEGLVGNKVRVAIETAPNEYYVGTTTGLSIIHADGSIKNIRQPEGLETEYVMAIYKDSHGIVWVGTDGGGIYLLKNEEVFSHLTSTYGIAGNVIFKISQDRKNNFWICTGSGVTRIEDFDATKGLRFKCATLNSENGLGTNSVFQVLFDVNDNIWLTNNHGIASISRDELDDFFDSKVRSVNTKYYSKNDGLDSDGPTSTARSIVDRNGRLWFTMVDGIAIYDPLKVQNAKIAPLIQIESIIVDNVEYKATDDTFILKPGTKRVDIKFTGLSFDAPERITFSHMLSNFDADYSIPDMNRVVSYTNIMPGRHSFQVFAINANGLKSDNEEIMLLWQKPYLYQRAGFWVVLIIVLVGSAFGYFRYRERKIKMENQRLEALVKVRTAALEQEKIKSDNLLRSILPDKIADKLKETTGNKSFGENFEDVTLLFSDIVGFTNVSSGHTAQEIVSALNKLFSMFDERAKQMGVEKIKTIGDAYMAACGVPEANENHASIMINFAMGMYQDLAKYNETADIKFNIRIGLNCGPVTAGVIGTTKFIYDVWGDTVNVASRMETAANPGAIRITEELKNKLDGKGFSFTEPIECKIKGKGMMKTFEVIQNTTEKK